MALTDPSHRLPLAEAEVLAEEVLALIGPWCDRIQIAGSLRRKAPTVGDIEIVGIPHTHQLEEPSFDLWSARTMLVNDLHERCADLLDLGVFSRRLDKNGRAAVGKQYQRLSYQGFGLDLFITTPAQWGVILTLRTGPADYSHRLVTSTRQGGLLPAWLQVQNGTLRHRSTGEVIPTPTEASFFEALDLPWVEPWRRT